MKTSKKGRHLKKFLICFFLLLGAATANAQAPLPGGRLTNTSGVCAPTTDQTAKTSMFYAPCPGLGHYIPIYDGTAMVARDFTSGPTDNVGLTLALGNNWPAGTLHDAFVTMNGASPALCTVPFASSGAGSSIPGVALAPYGGFMTNAAAIVCRTDNATTITVPANQGTYVGVFSTGAAGQVDLKFGQSAVGGGAACICIWNMNNRVEAGFSVEDSTLYWYAHTANTFEPLNAAAATGGLNNRITFVTRTASDPIEGHIVLVIGTAAGWNGQVGFALNATNNFHTKCPIISVGGGVALQQSGGNTCIVYPVPGLNYLQATEYATTTTGNVVFATGTPTSEAVNGKFKW
jgi:hypothetical protein